MEPTSGHFGSRPRGEQRPTRFAVTLLDRFALQHHGAPVTLSRRCQRLVVLLALSREGIARQGAAATLWPDLPVDRANANLRTTLWGLRIADDCLVQVAGGVLRLAAATSVDLDRAVHTAYRVNDATERLPDRGDVDLLFHDLLPSWAEEWLVVDQERHRQVRLHALERACDRLVALKRFGDAIDLGIAVVVDEPLRESAQRALIGAYLAEGNRAEALRQYVRHETLLRSELGVRPSSSMIELMAGAQLIEYAGD